MVRTNTPFALLVLATLTVLISGELAVTKADDTHDTYVSTTLDKAPNLRRHQLYSDTLKEQRIFDIALPASYAETAETHRYPVIIVMDGELLFPMVAGMVHQMAANSQMPESIVIGVQNTAGNRRSITPKPLDQEGKPYWFGGNEGAYLQFLSEELLPFAGNHYRTADFRTIIGLSPTGQFALHAFWKTPTLFDATIAINTVNFTAVGYGQQDIFEKVSESAGTPALGPRFLYISMPKGAFDRNPAISGAYQRLSKQAASWQQGTIRLKTESIDKNSYAATLPAITSALDFIFPASDWDPNYQAFFSDIPGETLEQVKTYFRNLSDDYGFAALPKGERFYNRNRLQRLGYLMIEQDRIAEAIEIFRYWIQLYPHAANAHDSLADALSAAGDTQGAQEARSKAVSLAARNQDGRLDLFQAKLEDQIAKSN